MRLDSHSSLDRVQEIAPLHAREPCGLDRLCCRLFHLEALDVLLN